MFKKKQYIVKKKICDIILLSMISPFVNSQFKAFPMQQSCFEVCFKGSQ